MLYNFGNYSYLDNNDDRNPQQLSNKEINELRFNEEYYNSLIANYEYNQAADYLSKFHFDTDIQKERANQQDIYQLRRKGNSIEPRIKSMLQTNPDGVYASSFYDAVFKDKGIENLISNNKYKQLFTHYINNFSNINIQGSESKKRDFLGIGIYGSESKQCDGYSITFKSKKRDFLGIDWLAKDAKEDDIDIFLKNNNWNKNYLQQNGVELIKNNDGSTTINFDTNNSLTNKLLYSVYKQGFLDTQIANSVYVSDTPNYSLKVLHPIATNIKLYTNNNGEKKYYDTDAKQYDNIRNFSNLIDEAALYKENLFSKNSDNEKTYPSTIGGFLDDNLAELNKAYRDNQIDDVTYHREYNHYMEQVDAVINSIGSGNYEIYSNYNHDDFADGKWTNQTMEKLDTKTAAAVMQYIQGTKSQDRNILTMTSNGRYGVLITVPQRRKDPEKPSNKIEDLVEYPEIQVFIPGLFSEEAEAQINQDTSTRAVAEASNLQDYEYGYNLYNGGNISYNGDGTYNYEYEDQNVRIDKNTAIQKISENMAIEDFNQNLIWKYTTAAGNIANKDALYTEMKNAAVAIANDVYPDINLTDVEEVFKMKGSGTTVLNEYLDKINMNTEDKLLRIYYIYEQLLKGNSYYLNKK